MAKSSGLTMQISRNTRLFGVLFAIAAAMLPRPSAAANGGVVYTYDALGRVTTVSYDTNVFIIYTYDANGNRLSETINVNTIALQWTATGGSCTSNCWGGALWHS